MTTLMSACVVVVVAMVAAINLALPELAGSDLRPTSTGLLWIVDAYILVFGCLLIPAGALADRLGRKGVLLAGLGIFSAGSIGSAAAQTVPVLLGARAVTGLGAALVMPATLSLLLQVTPAERKPHAIATWSAATGAAGALGNLGGGVILQWLPWQGLFLIMGPLATVLALLVARIAPPGERRPASLDPLGAGLVTAAVLLVLLAIIEGPEQGWTSGLVLGAAVGGVALAIAFVRLQLRREHPMIDPRIFSIPKVRTGAIGIAAVFFGLFALFFVNAQYLQYAKGYSPITTGIAILPLPLAMVVTSRVSVALGGRFGARRVVTAGLALLAAGLVAVSFSTAATPYLPYSVGLLLVAAGMGLSVPSLSTGIVTSLPASQAGVGSGINSSVREVGAALGVATVGTILANRFAGSLPTELDGGGRSVFQTLRRAEDLGPSIHAQAVSAFTGSMATALRLVAVIVVAGAIAVARGDAAGRRPSPIRTAVTAGGAAGPARSSRRPAGTPRGAARRA
jgi:EmrB/QacA subfamily drug resistance transporter